MFMSVGEALIVLIPTGKTDDIFPSTIAASEKSLASRGRRNPERQFVQMTSSRVRLGQSFKTVGYGSASCWGDLGAGSVEADVFYIPFIVSVQYIGY